MNDLVQRLSAGEHPVEASLRPERSVKAFRESIERGFVHVRFTGTRGGTELGFSIDQERSDLSKADFDNEAGRARLVGELTLDYIPVRCIANIELPSLTGTGHLEPTGASAA